MAKFEIQVKLPVKSDVHINKIVKIVNDSGCIINDNDIRRSDDMVTIDAVLVCENPVDGINSLLPINNIFGEES